MSGVRIADLERLLERLPSLRVLVVGDLLLDEYRLGDVERVSPEAPVPVVRVRQESFELGGAGNVARGVVSLGAGCELVGLLGEDREGEALRARARAIGLSEQGLVTTSRRPTSHKLRVVARGQQMLRLDREEDAAIAGEDLTRLRSAIEERLEACDAVILEDYGKGLFSETSAAPGLGRWLIERAREHGRPVSADPKDELARFRGATLLKPNSEEARRFVPGDFVDLQGRRRLLEKLQHELGGGDVVVTRGARGITALDHEGRAFDVPTHPLEVYDVQGAGDTTIATLALCRAAGASLLEACIVANAAASVAVEKVGTAAVTRAELLERLPEVLSAYESTAGERT